MKIYIVTGDTWQEEYGSQVDLFGTYSDLDKAEERKKSLVESYGYDVTITETSLNEVCEQHLG